MICDLLEPYDGSCLGPLNKIDKCLSVQRKRINVAYDSKIFSGRESPVQPLGMREIILQTLDQIDPEMIKYPRLVLDYIYGYIALIIRQYGWGILLSAR